MLRNFLTRVTCYAYFCIACCFFSACQSTQPASDEDEISFGNAIPKPVIAVGTGKSFFLTAETKILVSGDSATNRLGHYLSDLLAPATSFDVLVSEATDKNQLNAIYLSTSLNDTTLGKEGYRLLVEERQIKIESNAPAGLFYGIQTLRQLLPEHIESSDVHNGPWRISTGTIEDYPAYEWRGAMLDVSRHFFGVEDVKRYIDLIALYKFNILHLHLSDDQGWRIEIKSWPKLTTVGGKTEVGGGEGGFYTQEDYQEIVRYAQSRYVTIVPEIDMPGHINAALVSYPELNYNPTIDMEPGVDHGQHPDDEGKPRPVAGEVYTGIEVGFSTLHYNNKLTFKFIDDVIRELSSMTPGPYIHIGGDEAAVTKKQDYIRFVNRFKEIVQQYDKKMVGWEEIAQANIDSTVIVQFWDTKEDIQMAAQKGADVILSPSKRVYLDMQYDSTTRLGLHWAAYIELDDAYDWNPSTYIPNISPHQIRGIEAPLWTETIEAMDDIEFMVFPRLAAVAELAWSPEEIKNWDDFKRRLVDQGKRWDVMKIDFYKSPLVQWHE